MIYNINQVKNIFEGKNVIIVGPANNLIGTNLGEFIDSQDIVCRINSSYIISEELQKDYGRRCDVLFNGCNTLLLCVLNRHRSYIKDCKLVINPTSKIHYTDFNMTKKNVYENYKNIELDIPFYQAEGKYEKNMNEKGINTGMCSLDFLLNDKINIKQLYICGFSFYNIKKKIINNIKINPYHTYLFDINKYKCNCSMDKPCKKRIDKPSEHHDVNISVETKQKKFFITNILSNKKVKIHDTIKNII